MEHEQHWIPLLWKIIVNHISFLKNI
jgi:hypothetical protein